MAEQAKNAWITNSATCKKFWATAQDQFGLDNKGVHAILAVESLKDFTGTFEDAINALRAAVEAPPVPASAALPEAPFSINTRFVDKDGFEWQLTIRAASQQHLDRFDELTAAAWQGALWGRIEAKKFPSLRDALARRRRRRRKPLTLEQDVTRWQAFFNSAVPKEKAN